MKFSSPVISHKKAAAIRITSFQLLACAALLSGCASRPWMPFPARNKLKQISRTVIYVEPKGGLGVDSPPNPALLYAGGVAGGEAGTYAATGYLVFPATVFIYPVLLVASDIHKYRRFRTDIKPYLSEVTELNFSGYERDMVRKAVAEIGWPGAMPLEVVPASGARGYLERIAAHNQSRATIFIIPRGVRLSYDVRSIYVTYGVAAYVKNSGDAGKVSRLDSATIQTVQSIRFPRNIEHYNPLTSPTTDALADRMKMLFGDHAGFFMQSFKQALRVEQAKITCYFADSCPS